MRTSSAILCADVSGIGWVEKPKSVSGLVATTKPSCRSIATVYQIAEIRFQILFLFGFLLVLMCGWTPAA
jgi:hypothetical protein